MSCYVMLCYVILCSIALHCKKSTQDIIIIRTGRNVFPFLANITWRVHLPDVGLE